MGAIFIIEQWIYPKILNSNYSPRQVYIYDIII